MAARLTIYSGLRECQAGIQFCTDGGNGGRVYNSLWNSLWVEGEEGEYTFLLEWRELQRIYNSV
ncbi:hypothetical protein T02_15367 [Trichinella nativa]|uniref:Uncharacterized protein n=1 Tax=Trichinella nativa TaxID=6335 RepID=A0A0V1KIK6_9BILA|nr:hypothetical protein T02_15367 [Trichinella nativa]